MFDISFPCYYSFFMFLPSLLSGRCSVVLLHHGVFVMHNNEHCQQYVSAIFVSQSSDDDEQCEEKDRFVAQLYKFMDDRGKL